MVAGDIVSVTTGLSIHPTNRLVTSLCWLLNRGAPSIRIKRAASSAWSRRVRQVTLVTKLGGLVRASKVDEALKGVSRAHTFPNATRPSKRFNSACSQINICNQIDAIWKTCWTGGVSNPLEVIEQLVAVQAFRCKGNVLGPDRARLSIFCACSAAIIPPSCIT
jgi:hypothetical protein